MFYETNPDPTRFFQGDILASFPVTILPESVKIVRLEGKGEGFSLGRVYERDKLNDAFLNGSEAVLAKASLMNIMILSQTCDIEHREFVSIAPVFPITNIDSVAKQEAIRKRKVLYRFYLPLEGKFEESFLDITTINSVRRATLKLENRILALSHYGRSHLTFFINNYFNRPFQPD
jgi:hypothetical protein